MFETAEKGERMELYYLSKYPIRLCREYMTHFNIYDNFVYIWEERGGYYFITFEDYSDVGYSMVGIPRPIFKVVFEDFGDQTGIRTEFMNPWIFKAPWIPVEDIDRFWEIKLDAKRIKNDREKNIFDSIFSKLIKKRT